MFNSVVLRCYLIALLMACSLMLSLTGTNTRHGQVRLSAGDLQQMATVQDNHALRHFTPTPETLPGDTEEFEHAYFDDHAHEGDGLMPVLALQWGQRIAATWDSTYLVATKTAPVFGFERPPKHAAA